MAPLTRAIASCRAASPRRPVRETRTARAVGVRSAAGGGKRTRERRSARRAAPLRAGRREGPARRANGWTDRRARGGLTRAGAAGVRDTARARPAERQRKVPREQDRPLALVLRAGTRPPGAVKLKIYARRRLRRLTLRRAAPARNLFKDCARSRVFPRAAPSPPSLRFTSH